MARKGHGRPATLVDITSHPDDGSSPVGSNEWNANRDTTGVIGFTKKTEAVSSNNINITDSYVEVTSSGNEEIRTMSQVTTKLSETNYVVDETTKSFAEGDLLYLVKANASHAITLKNQYGGSGGAGKITTLTGGDLLLDVKVPRIFMCRTIGSNQEWVEYGGGSASDLDTTNFASGIIDTDLTSVAGTDTTIPSAKATKAFAEARANHTGTQAASTISDFDTEVANNSAVTANTAKVTNATHSGDVTGSTTLTYNNAIPVAKGGSGQTSYTAGDILYATGSTTLAKLAKGTAGQALKMNSGATAPEWATGGGGATATHAYTNQSTTTYAGTGTSGTGIDVNTTVSTEASGAGEREIFIKKIDANNEGVFAIIHKNGKAVEVQIA